MTMELKVALIQTTLVWENPQANRNAFYEKIREISNDVDLVILPEMFPSGFTMTPNHMDHTEGQKTLEWMLEISNQERKALVGSTPFYENGSFFNRLFFVEPNGTYYQYDKRHTFSLAGESKVYEGGKERLILEYKGFKFCPLICYDLRFPVWARNTEDYDVLLYVANWPKTRIYAWDTLLAARAIENMAYCIGVNRIGNDDGGYEYTGHSAVYDSLGKTLVFSEGETILYATLSKEHLDETRGKLKFLQDRDRFSLED
ncbi:nitrilase family protein [Flavobacteriaceae bacterium KMM 6897]|nr:nitrilase family protein [Flavobacteriaceae bacterium KMM 6897]MEB8346037.1 nitrilase family protein [Flavobacteriaceae bacterium KMM 6898]